MKTIFELRIDTCIKCRKKLPKIVENNTAITLCDICFKKAEAADLVQANIQKKVG